MVTTTDPAPWLAAVRRSHDRLAGLVSGMGPDQLARMSACSEWTVAQVLSHLGSQAQIFGLWVDAGLSGRQPPSPEVFGPIWATWNGRSPTDQARDSVSSNAALVERLEGLGPERLGTLHLELFGRQLGAAGLLRLRLAEHAVHTWDVAVAADPAAEVAGDAVELLIDGLGEVAGYAGRPSAEPLHAVVTTTDPGRRFTVVATDTVRVDVDVDADDAHAPQGRSIELPGEAFLRLVYGRLDDTYPPRGPVHADGVRLEDLRRIFKGI